jgi:hypothetical protein
MQMPGADDVCPDFTPLADDLLAAWNTPRTTMRTRQRLVRALIIEIIVDIDEAAGEKRTHGKVISAGMRCPRHVLNWLRAIRG